MARAFISYKRHPELDEPVAMRLYDILRSHHDIFVDQKMGIGTKWAEEIERQLRAADFLIVFLSEQSVHSEMVLGEVDTAHRLASEQGGRPTILPVRLKYREPFRYPLSAYLNPINWGYCDGLDDVENLARQLDEAMAGGGLPIGSDAAKEDLTRSAGIPPLEPPLGPVDPQSPLYIGRRIDGIALDAIRAPQATITIQGAKQMGKSSLMMRVLSAAEEVGKTFALIDFHMLDNRARTDADCFYPQFCGLLANELGSADPELNKYWDGAPIVSRSLQCQNYLQNHALRNIGPDKTLVLAIDAMELLFNAPFGEEFFGMLRNCHALRSVPVRKTVWKRLNLVLVTSTDPSEFIRSERQSPFNVGTQVVLQDFDEAQVHALNALHGPRLTSADVTRLYQLVGGHPYLVRRALWMIASEQCTPADLFLHAAQDDGPFGDHLRNYFLYLHNKLELVDGFKGVLRNGTYADKIVVERLRGAGLIRQNTTGLAPRCDLYRQYYKDVL